jgi:hypothetical protein
MTTIAFRPPTGPHAGARGPAFGLGISLLVHAGVLAWLMHALAPLSTNPADDKPAARMQIRLETARPVQPTAPAAAAPAEPASVRPAAPARPVTRPVTRPALRPHPRADAPASASAAAPARASETPDVITSRRTNAPDLFAVPQAAPSEPSTGPDGGPIVDLDAARREARRIAREGSRNLVSLPARKPVTDPNEGRPADVDPLEKARRSDCKSAYAGLGLLAVIPLAKDAITGTGCKW